MGIEIIDCPKLAWEKKKRTVVMNTRKMHAWVHFYPEPGDHDDMHCHNEDQTFYCIEGQCTMHFPDGGKAALDPGMAALITGGSFYMLENTGDAGYAQARINHYHQAVLGETPPEANPPKPDVT